MKVKGFEYSSISHFVSMIKKYRTPQEGKEEEEKKKRTNRMTFFKSEFRGNINFERFKKDFQEFPFGKVVSPSNAGNSRILVMSNKAERSQVLIRFNGKHPAKRKNEYHQKHQTPLRNQYFANTRSYLLFFSRGRT